MSRTVTIRSHHGRFEAIGPTRLSIAHGRLPDHLGAVPAASLLGDCLAGVPDATAEQASARAALSSLCTALGAMPGVPDLLSRHGCDIDVAQQVAADEARPLTEVSSALEAVRESTVSAQRFVADAERRILATEFASALAGTGWSVRTADNELASSLHAYREGQHLVALLPVDGETTIDVAGCEVDHCGPLLADTFALLRERGIAMEVIDEQIHGDSRGGTLIQQAARESRRAGQTGSLEIGALDVAVATSLTRARPVRRGHAQQEAAPQRIRGAQ